MDKLWERRGAGIWRYIEAKYPGTTTPYTSGLRIPGSHAPAVAAPALTKEQSDLHQARLRQWFAKHRPEKVGHAIHRLDATIAGADCVLHLQAHRADELWPQYFHHTWTALETKYPGTTAEFIDGLYFPPSARRTSSSAVDHNQHPQASLHKARLGVYLSKYIPAKVRAWAACFARNVGATHSLVSPCSRWIVWSGTGAPVGPGCGRRWRRSYRDPPLGLCRDWTCHPPLQSRATLRTRAVVLVPLDQRLQAQTPLATRPEPISVARTQHQNHPLQPVVTPVVRALRVRSRHRRTRLGVRLCPTRSLQLVGIRVVPTAAALTRLRPIRSLRLVVIRVVRAM